MYLVVNLLIQESLPKYLITLSPLVEGCVKMFSDQELYTIGIIDTYLPKCIIIIRVE